MEKPTPLMKPFGYGKHKQLEFTSTEAAPALSLYQQGLTLSHAMIYAVNRPKINWSKKLETLPMNLQTKIVSPDTTIRNYESM